MTAIGPRFAIVRLRAALLGVSVVAASLGTLCVAARAAVPPVRSAATARVYLHHASVGPSQLDILVGDTVQWTNASSRDHTVTASTGLFDSGTVTRGHGYSFTFSTAGSFPYGCRLHPSVAGKVDAYPLLLSGPSREVFKGEAIKLSGRAAAGSPSVTIERDGGTGFQPVGTAAVGPDGAFTSSFTAAATASYRAVSGPSASPVVRVAVTDRVRISLSARRRGRFVILRTKTTPPQPRRTVSLQLRLRERFGWWTVARRHLDRNSRARFKLRGRVRAPARVVLTGPDGVTILSSSDVLRARRDRQRGHEH